MLHELFDQHRAILDAAEVLRVGVRRSPRINIDELARLRTRLCNLIKEHHQLEEVLVFTPALRHGGIIGRPGIRTILQQIQEQRSSYYDNVHRWTAEAVQADWNGYVASVELRVRSLNELIRIEEEEFFPPVMMLAAA